jgi:hypothetical protein
MTKKQKLELTWIGKEKRPKLEPRILLEDPEKSYHAQHRVSDNDIIDNRLIFGDNLLALKALEAVDGCVGKVVQAVLERDGTVLITSDHGNADEMADSEGHTVTAHTTNPVPFIYINRNVEGVRLREGSLRDIAPTMLQLLGIPKPAEMTGDTLMTTEE